LRESGDCCIEEKISEGDELPVEVVEESGVSVTVNGVSVNGVSVGGVSVKKK
jgi:hypothetical protein